MQGRRSFVTAIIALIHSSVAVAVGWPGLRLLFAPSKRSKRSAEFIDIAPLSILEDGKPVAITVVADRWDAYAHLPPGPIGRVWLVPESGETRGVRCFQSICPHLGCGIDHDESSSSFSCPCHGAKFSGNGQSLEGPSPRAMDELPCRVTKANADGDRRIEIQYQEFQIGKSDQISTT